MANRKKKDNTNMEKVKREMAAKMQKATSKKKSEDKVIDHDLTVENTSQAEISEKVKENPKKESTGRKNRRKVQEQIAVENISLNETEANNQSVYKDDLFENVSNSTDPILDKPPVETPITENAEEVPVEESGKELLEETPKESAEEINRTKVVIFRMGREEFAMDINVVKEITHLPELIHVPEAPYYIAGLCSLRGELLPIIDSKKLFHLNQAEIYESNRVIVMEVGEKKVGLLVDKVSEILSVEASDIKESPANLKGDSNNIKGMILLSGGKRIVLLIDPVKINELGNCHDGQDILNTSPITKQGQTEKYEEEQVVVFYVGEEEYALEVQYVKEIIRYPGLIRIPYTSDYIDGVTSLRENLVAIISLDKLMGSQPKEINDNRRVIIIDNGHSSYGIVVDGVSNITRVNKSNIRVNTMNAFSEKSSYIKGFIDLVKENRVIILLNSSNLIDQKDVDLIQEASKQTSPLEIIEENKDIHYDKFVIFRLADVEFAMQIQYVKEINNMNEIVNFPGAPSFIEGLTNLRDEIIPILNLKSMLYGEGHAYVANKFLVVEYNKKKVGMLIDSASDVLEISQDEVDNATKDMQGYDRNYIETVAKLNKGKRIVLLLNLAGILSFL